MTASVALIEVDIPIGDPQPGVEVIPDYFSVRGAVMRDWGVHAGTSAYFDENGPDAGDEAVLLVGLDHKLSLIQASELN